jgi:hypothetical protein
MKLGKHTSETLTIIPQLSFSTDNMPNDIYMFVSFNLWDIVYIRIANTILTNYPNR